MVKGSDNGVSGPKRRLDLDDDTNKTESKKEEVGKRQLVDNPYKKPKSNTSAADASIITPETGIEKFFTKDKKDDGKKKVPPAAKRKLVSPSRGVEEQQKSDTRSGKEELYYHSDNSSEGQVPKETILTIFMKVLITVTEERSHFQRDKWVLTDSSEIIFSSLVILNWTLILDRGLEYALKNEF